MKEFSISGIQEKLPVVGEETNVLILQPVTIIRQLL